MKDDKEIHNCPKRKPTRQLTFDFGHFKVIMKPNLSDICLGVDRHI